MEIEKIDNETILRLTEEERDKLTKQLDHDLVYGTAPNNKSVSQDAFKLNRKPIGTKVCCYICGASNETLYKDPVNPGQRFCKRCKETVASARKMMERGCYEH